VKPLLLIAAALLAWTPTQPNHDYGLPELHTIKTVTLAPSYSCRTREESRRGYDTTALFLSKYSDDRNAPDLLFNGACGAEDSFQGSTAGDDMSLISDLGSVPLEDVTSSKAFNFKRIHDFNLYSKFAQEVKVESGHTYAVLINKGEVRGLFVFKVTDYVPNKKAVLQYAVKEYQVMNVTAQSEGFSWDMKNQFTLPLKVRPVVR